MKKKQSLPPLQLSAAVANQLKNLFDFRSFGGHTVYAEGDAVDADAQFAELSLDKWPYLLHREDYDALRDMHRRLIDAPKNLHPSKNPADTILLIGYAAASKVIVLVQNLLICHNYYNVKSVRYPGFKPSDLFDVQITHDLVDALQYVKWVLIDEPEKNGIAKTAALNDIYRVMKMLLDLLAGWLPCAETDDLRNAYTVFHTTCDNGEALERVKKCLQALSMRFANEEPKWERERAEGANGIRQPLIQYADDFQKAAGALKVNGKKNRRGSGLKGTKSTKMAQQRADFEKWLEGNPINEGDPQKNIGARANQYWQQHKKSMESAARATGEKRGYKNAKCLADAYRKR